MFHQCKNHFARCWLVVIWGARWSGDDYGTVCGSTKADDGHHSVSLTKRKMKNTRFVETVLIILIIMEKTKSQQGAAPEQAVSGSSVLNLCASREYHEDTPLGSKMIPDYFLPCLTEQVRSIVYSMIDDCTRRHAALGDKPTFTSRKPTKMKSPKHFMLIPGTDAAVSTTKTIFEFGLIPDRQPYDKR